MLTSMLPKLLVPTSGVALVLVFLFGWYLLSTQQQYLHPADQVQGFAESAPAIPLSRNYKHAYVFYATADTYACSALVNAHRIRNLTNSTLPIYLLASPSLSAGAVAAIRKSPLNITVVHDTAPPLGPDDPNGAAHYAAYYDEVLLKLRALQLHHVNPVLERIIVLDSDQLVRKTLEHLFNLPAVDIAAPLMYWGDMSVTTTLMVATLSDELWGIIDGALRHMRSGEYDMDLVNRVLKKRLMILPGRYCTLNSHWEVQDIPGWFKGYKLKANATSEELEELYEKVEVLHFTAMGKPWSVSPDQIAHNREVMKKSQVHPLFVEQFREWHEDAKKVCGHFWKFVEPFKRDP